MTPRKVERGSSGSETVIRIEQGGLPPISIKISSGGVEIRPIEKPLLLKPTGEKPINQKFRQAVITAAASLLDHNLPDPDDRPLLVDDKLKILEQVTWRLLTAHRWGKKQLRIQVDLAQRDLSQLISRRGIITATEWERCQQLLAHEIEGTISRFQEEQFKRKAIRVKK